MKIEKQIRQTPQVGAAPYGQVHAHSTGNPNSTAQDEAGYMSRKNLEEGFYTHVVGNGRVIQTANVNRGAWDVGNQYNNYTYAAVELIESHKTKADFLKDYEIYVELLRDLAKQAKIPAVLDSNSEVGIKTHKWCTDKAETYGGHVDPYPYLGKWGISKAQFQKDVKDGMTKTPTYIKKFDKPIRVKALKDIKVYHDKERTKASTILYAKDSVFILDEYIEIPGRVSVGKPRAGGYVTLNTDWVKAL